MGFFLPMSHSTGEGKLQEKTFSGNHRLFSKWDPVCRKSGTSLRITSAWSSIHASSLFQRVRGLREAESHRTFFSETLHSEQSFVENHLGIWVPNSARKMISEAGEDYFRGSAHLTVGLIGYIQFA